MLSALKTSWLRPYPSHQRSSNALVAAFFAVCLRCCLPLMVWLPAYMMVAHIMVHQAWIVAHLPFSSLLLFKIFYLLCLSLPVVVFLYLLFYRMQCLLDGHQPSWSEYRSVLQSRWIAILNLQWMILAIGLCIVWASMLPFMFVLLLLMLPLMFTPMLIVFFNHGAWSAIAAAYKLIRGRYWFSFVVMAKGQIFFSVCMMIAVLPLHHVYANMPTWLQACMVYVLGFIQLIFFIGCALLLMHELMLSNPKQADRMVSALSS